MVILPQCSRHLIGSTSTYLSLRRIFKSISKSPKIVLANNNSNWVDIPEAEKPLLLSETAISQQPSQLIDLLAKTLRKLAANLTPTINPPFSIAKTHIQDTFNSIDPKKNSTVFYSNVNSIFIQILYSLL